MVLAYVRSVLSAVSLCLVALLVPVAGASAAEPEPEHVPWTEALPPAPAGYEPVSDSPLCPAGQTRCVDLVIREMRRRFNPLASRCDHDAVFALTYLRTTEEYRRAVSNPTFFWDNAFKNHLAVVFADAYFRAYDGWHRRTGPVPPAWQVAFSAADGRSVTGSGNLLLGMSAHVNRDLPFVFEQLGTVAPDGTSRKPDHDRVNQILVRVVDDVLPEGARRFDPSMDDGNVTGTTLDETATFQLLVLWREEAWRNAERLVAARTPAERELVARDIENSAAAKGRLLAETLGYRPPLTGPHERDAWCAQHWDDA
jgi:hypothetical protein